MDIRVFSAATRKEIAKALDCSAEEAEVIFNKWSGNKGRFYVEKFIEVGASPYHAAVVYSVLDWYAKTNSKEVQNDGVSKLTVSERHNMVMCTVDLAYSLGIVPRRDFVGKT